MALKIGDDAPLFSLTDQDGKLHELAQYRGQWVVLFFYPKDRTPGCTIEACQFRDNYAQFQADNVKILGINTDSMASHARFSSQYQLPYPLLADMRGEVSQMYEVLFKLGFIKFCKRRSFIVNPQGKISAIYSKVNVMKHVEQVHVDLADFQKIN